MSSTGARKPHAVCVPYPSQGHVTPMMHLAKLLHSRGFHITFVNTEFNHGRLIRSRGPDSVEGLPDFRFETIPDGLPLPPSDFDATQDVPSLCDSTRKNCMAPFKELLTKLNSSSEVPPVTCVISDGVMSFGIKAAEEFNIPQVQFWTASACSFMGYLHFNELTRRGFVPYKENLLRDGYTPIDWIPGLSNIRLKDMPTFIRTTNDEIMFDFMGSEAENCLNSPAIIFNTFNEFENEVLESIIATKFPNIYTVGPLPLLLKHIPAESESRSLGSSLWKEDLNCLDWLDKRGHNSVVYINYGSVTVMTDTHLREFAWGLANSKLPFLWIIRPDVVMGDSAILPEEFLEQIDGRGLLASWCPQDQVLAHPSVGVFLTHCGWNSMMETISCGVPVICWPFFADQQPNCRYACTKWGIGVEVNHDVKRNEIESLVKEMIEGDSGKQMRQKALEWKDIAEAATSIGGSSYNNFEKFIKEALLLCKEDCKRINGIVWV
ncbi:PREDICTED: 7-deoxyloganetin glucosyltransferase-like isoform X2 [Populus euphratica]|uniref:Glycosyltransferase n=1 Tax=Populus euphratica TaxID=75702 RepID=A0AAJ6XU27_POPEU|nr:PREDICTED: 7-deoxyloganetin glucosyltransferase-like isoform X2 [Populus euphratica]